MTSTIAGHKWVRKGSLPKTTNERSPLRSADSSGRPQMEREMIGRKLSPSLFLSFACSFFLSFVLFFLYRLYNRNVLAATTIKDTEETDGRTDGLRSEAAAWRTEGTERERGRAGGHCTASEFTGSPQRESSTDGRASELRV